MIGCYVKIMDYSQLKEIAKLSVTKEIATRFVINAILKAMENVRTEREEMTGQLDEGMDDLVKPTTGQSIAAFPSRQTSTTDHKMAEMTVQPGDEVDDIHEAGKTIGQSITDICRGKTSPTDHKMAEMLGQQDKFVDDFEEVIFGQSLTTICDGHTSPADHKIESREIPERDTGTGNDKIIQKPNVYATDKDHKSEAPSVVTEDKAVGKVRQTFFERHLNRLLGRKKKDAKKVKTELHESVPSGGSRNLSSKVHNKRDWILKHILCCFICNSKTSEEL
ncbi:uncharacterized protein LOC117328654 [Pecten maximus]|uniref:uncharacterized protein LOC117328654 n=1 Tax=Pecten maximus TaxID=6579 RepID=UPI001457F773|nr:uncharacterized protein LOC117328654 [Pecten maximus]